MEKNPYQKYFQVVYEDNHLLIVNKASGVLVQGDQTGDPPLSEMAKEFLKQKYNKPGNVFVGVVHRLDRPVSGLVVLAKTSKGLERMNLLFRRRDVKKTYWAIVGRRPEHDSAKLTHWLMKDESRNVVTAYDEPKGDAQKAELTYEYKGTLNGFHLLEVLPVTGRPHQIRVQLASIGSPIRGDVKYGFAKPNRDASISLHARRLDFIHPIKKEPLICLAGIPDDGFWDQFLTLEKPDVKDKNLDFLH
ncbi:23S rRNA pseudouridine1911/1915/1917 synthase [Catalinimonas alkaloidigena]|uniref:23S rRNA pseudouridine1911/1915/1917 synthase n=1 Tax=Catalinimonas alkaloidigena TaxID=1075417 RepID=A0A1G9EXZ2_9BACT|nr:RluA family pseudouridine synthase [Catalinimonas alkaloidigena]SDK81024.1 23S rRNA pseudouridine1911/1915/1917 synthase [Catalinimonas alkaloidigena]